MFEFIIITTLFTVNGKLDKHKDLIMGSHCPFSYKQINELDRTIKTNIDGLIVKKGKVLIAQTCRTKKQILRERRWDKILNKNVTRN